jgi:hypothetical protein
MSKKQTKPRPATNSSDKTSSSSDLLFNPPPWQRARFMSAQNAVQHLSSAAGAFLASMFLSADETGRLHGMPEVALAAIVISLFVPVLTGIVERGVKRREAEAALR